jgi:hypothetical protein
MRYNMFYCILVLMLPFLCLMHWPVPVRAMMALSILIGFYLIPESEIRFFFVFACVFVFAAIF